MSSFVKITFFDKYLIEKIKSIRLKNNKCKSIDIPANAVAANYCFYGQYIGCSKCDKIEEESESDCSDVDVNEHLKCIDNSVKVTFSNINGRKCSFFDSLFNFTSHTFLRRDMCIFFGIPDDAVKVNVCFFYKNEDHCQNCFDV